MNPLNSIKGTIISGVVLAIIIAALIGGVGFNGMQFDRWLHVLSGVLWIGLLYYFNFVQVPALGEAAADEGGPGGGGITKYVAPLALLWFRWAALATWLTGAYYLMVNKNLIGAFMLGMGGDSLNVYQLIIGLGAWMGTIMLFNVWHLIWPNQKKVLGIVEATADEIARAKRVAFLASRTNTFLSIPMLMCMTGAVHGLPF
ncbi:MAG: urate hydroxylase PuuD [Gammaproteobacteria bacterium]